MQSSHVGISFFFLIPTASPETPVNPSPFPTSRAQGLLAYPSNHEYPMIACPPFLLVAFLSGAVREAALQADVSTPSQLGWKVLESFYEEFKIGGLHWEPPYPLSCVQQSLPTLTPGEFTRLLFDLSFARFLLLMCFGSYTH
jgi:hypothetical protein